MSNYRRWYVPGGTYFFTLVTYRRRPLFRDAAARELLGRVLRQVAAKRPFQTIATVLLWNHLHVVWTLPIADEDYSSRVREIKRDFTHEWLSSGGADWSVNDSRRSRGQRGVWQRRFWEHVIRDEADLENHCDYCHYNPVKHGYVARPWDWEWSSFRRFVSLGQYPRDWGSTEPPRLHDVGGE